VLLPLSVKAGISADLALVTALSAKSGVVRLPSSMCWPLMLLRTPYSVGPYGVDNTPDPHNSGALRNFAPAPQLVAGVALSLARAAAAAPSEDGGPPEVLPPAFPEELRELALFCTKIELVGECALDEAQPPRRAALEKQLQLFGAAPQRKPQQRSRDARRARPPRAMLRVGAATPLPPTAPPLYCAGRRRVACAFAAVPGRLLSHQLAA
jgi:hypothetical protein